MNRRQFLLGSTAAVAAAALPLAPLVSAEPIAEPIEREIINLPFAPYALAEGYERHDYRMIYLNGRA